MRNLRWPRRSVTLALYLAIVTGVSMLLRVLSPALLIADSPHDDELYARLAGSMLDHQWLGPYDRLTLAKGPSYSMFVAAVFRAHLPLKPAEQMLHLLAAAVIALAVYRVCRSAAVAAAAYTVVALNPAYLGAWGSKVSRDGFYASVSLLLLGTVVLVLTLVPPLARRGWAWMAALAPAGLFIGAVAAAYYLCREERIWLVPALAVAAVAGVVTWRGTGPLTLRHGVAVAGLAAFAVVGFGAPVRAVSERNQQAYGTGVTIDSVDGSFALAVADWARVDAGPTRDFVLVSHEQREAVYAISPAAARLEDFLEGEGTAWWALGCRSADVCDDYVGGYFPWALRDAAASIGSMDSGAEAERFFARVADEIEAACGRSFGCRAPGVGQVPPLSTLDKGRLASSYWDVSQHLFRYEVGEPKRAQVSGGQEDYWAVMTRPLRGVGDQADYQAYEARLLRHQQPISVLAWLYRWGLRLGVWVAAAGLVVGVLTRAGRSRPAVLLLALACLVAVLVRIAVVAVIDATAWPAAWIGVYILPGTDFLVLFVLLGSWSLWRFVRERSQRPAPAGADADAAGPELPPASAAEVDTRRTGRIRVAQ